MSADRPTDRPPPPPPPDPPKEDTVDLRRVQEIEPVHRQAAPVSGEGGGAPSDEVLSAPAAGSASESSFAGQVIVDEGGGVPPDSVDSQAAAPTQDFWSPSGQSAPLDPQQQRAVETVARFAQVGEEYATALEKQAQDKQGDALTYSDKRIAELRGETVSRVQAEKAGYVTFTDKGTSVRIDPTELDDGQRHVLPRVDELELESSGTLADMQQEGDAIPTWQGSGTVVQEQNDEALQEREAIRSGETMFRYSNDLTGALEGQFYSTENPLSEGFFDRMGVPEDRRPGAVVDGKPVVGYVSVIEEYPSNLPVVTGHSLSEPNAAGGHLEATVAPHDQIPEGTKAIYPLNSPEFMERYGTSQRVSELRGVEFAAESEVRRSEDAAKAEARGEVTLAERDIASTTKQIKDIEGRADNKGEYDWMDSAKLDELQQFRTDAYQRLDENLAIVYDPNLAVTGEEKARAEEARTGAQQAQRDIEEAERRLAP